MTTQTDPLTEIPETPNTNAEIPAKSRRQSAILRFILFIALILCTIYLLTEIAQLNQRVAKIEKATTEIYTDLLNMNSELSSVGALARNANMYAHSHSYSDAHLKSDIQPYQKALASINKLRPVTFYWNDSAPTQLKSQSAQQIGLIAQEVEKVYPQLVGTSPDGYKTVDYEMLVPALIAGMQEQQAQIDVLKSQVDTLKQCPAQ